MKKNLPMIIIVSVVSVILVIVAFSGGIGAPAKLPTAEPTATIILPTNTPIPTLTPDVCSPENIGLEVERLDAITREFDDTFGLAQTLQIQDTLPLVQDMQRIRRNAEDFAAPACLAKLKEHQILYMNSGINVFTNVYAYTSSVQRINQDELNSITIPLFEKVLGAAKLYIDEKAKLMGWTPVPIPTLEGSSTVTTTATP